MGDRGVNDNVPDGMPNLRGPAWIEVLQELHLELRDAYAAIGIEVSPEEQCRLTKKCLDEVWLQYFAHHMFKEMEIMQDTMPAEEDDE